MKSFNRVDRVMVKQENQLNHRLVIDWRQRNNDLPLLLDRYDSLTDLENDYNRYWGIPIELRIIIDNASNTIFGQTNTSRYNTMKTKLLAKQSKDLKTYTKTTKTKEVSIDPINMIMMMKECASSQNPNSDDWMKFYLPFSEAYNTPEQDKEYKDNLKEISEMVKDKYFQDNRLSLDEYTYLPSLTPQEIIDSKVPMNIEEKGYQDWLEGYDSLFKGNPSKYLSTVDYIYHRVKELKEKYSHTKDPLEKSAIFNLLLAYGTLPSMPNKADTKSKIRDYLKYLNSEITFYDLTDEDIEFKDLSDKEIEFKDLYTIFVCRQNEKGITKFAHANTLETLKNRAEEYSLSKDNLLVFCVNRQLFNIADKLIELDTEGEYEHILDSNINFKLFLTFLMKADKMNYMIYGTNVYKIQDHEKFDYYKIIKIMKYIDLSEQSLQMLQAAKNKFGELLPTDESYTMEDIKGLLKF